MSETGRKHKTTKSPGRGFFENWPEPTSAERAKIRAEAKKNRRPCECPGCLAGEKVRGL